MNYLLSITRSELLRKRLTNLLQTMIAFLFIVPTTVMAATSYQLSKQSTAPTIDGKLDEPMWKLATKVELAYENQPGNGVAAKVKTTGYIYQDGESLHIAMIAYDKYPEKIRGALRDHDKIWRDDNMGIILDTFNDERSGYLFFVNPKGAQSDERINDDNGWREDDAWDAIWYSAARVTDDGWVAEISIPFKALRFKDNQDTQQWGFTLWRNQPREVRRQFGSYQSNRDSTCSLCLYNKLNGFEGIKSGNNIQVTPTATIKRSDSKPASNDPWSNGKAEQDLGLDLRWGITQNSVLNATLNPDFSQVEADSTDLDINTSFALYTREKRPFFLDGADNFKTSRLNLVHTRNINQPDYGVKLTGQLGQHTYGILNAKDQQTNFLLPSAQGSRNITLTENNGDLSSQNALIRYKNDMGNRNNLGLLVSRRQADGYSNTIVSGDGNHWFDKQSSLQYQVAFSDSNNSAIVRKGFDVEPQQKDHAIDVYYSHSQKDYNYYAGYQDIGTDFRADLGFIGQVDFKQLQLGGGRTYYNDDIKEDFVNRYGFFSNTQYSQNQAGEKLGHNIDIRGFANGKMQSFANFGFMNNETRHDNQFNRDGGELYNNTQFVSYSSITPLSALKLQFFTRIGKQLDYANAQLGTQFYLHSTINYQYNEHLAVTFNNYFNQLDVDETHVVIEGKNKKIASGQLYRASKSNLNLAYQFDQKNQLKLIVQYSDIKRNPLLYKANHDSNTENDYLAKTRNFSTQLLYTYKVNPQSLIYVGYSDGGYQPADDNSLHRDRRTFFAKFSYAWQG